MRIMSTFEVRSLLEGVAEGPLQVLGKPLSFWGGYDPHDGTIIDTTHPNRGLRLAGCVVAMHEARGSSSSSSVFAEAARLGTAPAAIILTRVDPILVIGALVADDLYQVKIPIVVLSLEHWSHLSNATTARVDAMSAQITLQQ